MLLTLYHSLFYDPIYNGLVFLIDVIPGGDVGVAVIVLTIVVRLILLPLALKATRTQLVTRAIDPEMKRIKEVYKNDRQEQAKQTMALYKKYGINPLASFAFLFLQLLLIISLYLVFWRGGLPDIHTNLLYSFVDVPPEVSMLFLGFFDVTIGNFALAALPLALLAGVTQFIQAKLSVPPISPDPSGARSFKNDLAKSFNLQMRYAFPVLIFFLAWSFPAIIALYFVVSNIVSIGQELYVRRTMTRASLPQQNGAGVN